MPLASRRKKWRRQVGEAAVYVAVQVAADWQTYVNAYDAGHFAWIQDPLAAAMHYKRSASIHELLLLLRSPQAIANRIRSRMPTMFPGHTNDINRLLRYSTFFTTTSIVRAEKSRSTRRRRNASLAAFLLHCPGTSWCAGREVPTA